LWRDGSLRLKVRFLMKCKHKGLPHASTYSNDWRIIKVHRERKK
jgi:hypothetical protein